MQPLGHDDPRRIGDYRLLGVLGAGGMGRVYLGRNTGGRTVAVKVIRPDLITDPEFRVRFQREVSAARRVGGSCTAPVLDADVNADPPWLATGYVAGLALSEAVERFGPFGERSLLVLARGLAEALVAVHEAGVVHRDLKPSNVLLAVDGPKVIDFGIARAVEDTALTATGTVIGSPAFMCPEQVTGEPVGPAGDMFALGGVLTYAASGQGPFGGGDTVQLLFRIVYEQPRLEAVPEAMRELVAACLAKNPDDRPAPRQVLDHLDRLGATERAGWLPAAVLEEVSQRAVRLLDLDSGPGELPGYPVGPQPGGHPPAYGSVPGPGSYGTQSNPNAGHAIAQPVTNRWDSGAPGRTDPTAVHTPGAPWSGAHPGTALPAAARSEFARPGPAPAQWFPDSAPPGAQAGHGRPGDERSGAGATGAPPPRDGRSDTGRTAGRPARRGPLIAALVVVGTAVAAGAFFIGSQLRDDRPDSTTASSSTTVAVTTTEATTTTSATTASATTTTTAAAVPADFVGTWRGSAADGLISFDIQMTIEEGEIGAELAQSSNTGKLTGHRCSRIERLTDVTGDQLTFVARLDPDSPGDCADDGAVSTVRLQPDGSLAYSTPGLFGGEIAGILRRG